jgi:Ca-activated chloride channel family protein
LPGEGRGYKRDGEGRVVTTRLDADTLAAIAAAGGGRFLQVSASLAESRRLVEEIDRMEKADLSSRIVTSHIDRYQIPLALALLLLGCEPLVAAARRPRRDV